MKSHIVIEGEFLHASLYYGQLTTLAYSGEIQRFSLPTLRTGPSFDRGAIKSFVHRQIESGPSTTDRKVTFRPPSNAEILALHSYDGVTYLGARDGLWAMRENAARNGAFSDYDRIVDGPVLDVDTAFGVAAVAHGDSVTVIPLGSDWLSYSYFQPITGRSESPTVRVRWTHHDIIGRTSPLDHELIPANFELREYDDEQHYVFQGLRAPHKFHGAEAATRISAIGPRSFAQWDTTSNTSLLYHKSRGGWSQLDPDGEPSYADPVEQATLRGAVPGRVISLNEFKNYLVCEMSDRVSLVDSKGEEHIVLAHPATDVRVYPRSRRYRGILTAVSDLGVHILEPGRSAGREQPRSGPSSPNEQSRSGV